MKSETIVPAVVIAVASLFSSSIAEASCQNICVRALRDCLASSVPDEACWAEHAECLNACAGGDGISGTVVLKDEDPQPRVEPRGSAQICAIKHGENAASWAVLALMPEPAFTCHEECRIRCIGLYPHDSVMQNRCTFSCIDQQCGGGPFPVTEN